MFSNIFMEAALEQAKKAFSIDEIPVGAVVVKDNQIIAYAHNISISAFDSTAHAEILAIRNACQALKTNILNDCDIYVTLEPCPMCAQAISIARIKRLYFGATDTKSGGVISGAQIYNWPAAHHKPEVYSGIMEDETSKLLRDFFKTKR